jgi:hypothetical protein
MDIVPRITLWKWAVCLWRQGEPNAFQTKSCEWWALRLCFPASATLLWFRARTMWPYDARCELVRDSIFVHAWRSLCLPDDSHLLRQQKWNATRLSALEALKINRPHTVSTSLFLAVTREIRRHCCWWWWWCSQRLTASMLWYEHRPPLSKQVSFYFHLFYPIWAFQIDDGL